MTSVSKIIRGVAWTVGTYVVSIITRFGSNIILSRLLTPETFGMLMITHTVRQGVELSADLGFAQNTIQNKAGDRPAFFNTIWVMQIVRGILLCSVLFIAADSIARLYAVPANAFQLSGAILLAGGFTSTSIFLLHRRLQLATLNLFDLAMDAIGAALAIAAALISPTIISMMVAALLGTSIRMVASHFLTSTRNRIQFDRAHAREIFAFGRWIFLSSILTFLCASFDRLYIGQAAPLAIVGIYSIARTLADMPALLAVRVGYSVVFPVVSGAQAHARSATRAHLSGIRFKLLILAAIGCAFGISVADWAIQFVYDARYHDAAWMLPIMLFGVWLIILCAVNEYALLGFGKPVYAVIANSLKLAYYLVALPLAYRHLGILGAILVIVLSDVARYAVIAFGQRHERFSFLRQDAVATLIFLTLVAGLSWARSYAGFGTPFDAVPLDQLLALLGRLDG